MCSSDLMRIKRIWTYGRENVNIFINIKLDHITYETEKNKLRWIIDLNIKAIRDKLLGGNKKISS